MVFLLPVSTMLEPYFLDTCHRVPSSSKHEDYKKSPRRNGDPKGIPVAGLVHLGRPSKIKITENIRSAGFCQVSRGKEKRLQVFWNEGSLFLEAENATFAFL